MPESRCVSFKRLNWRGWCRKDLYWQEGGSPQNPRRQANSKKGSGAPCPDLFFLAGILLGTGIFLAGVQQRLDQEGRPWAWLGKQQIDWQGWGQSSGTCSSCVSAGEYQCYFEAQGFRWELYYVVRVPLETTDVAWLPDQLFISCATSPGFQLRCCVPSTHPTYVVSWIWRRQQRSGEGPVLGGQELVFQLTGHRMQFTLESGA